MLWSINNNNNYSYNYKKGAGEEAEADLEIFLDLDLTVMVGVQLVEELVDLLPAHLGPQVLKEGWLWDLEVLWELKGAMVVEVDGPRRLTPHVLRELHALALRYTQSWHDCPSRSDFINTARIFFYLVRDIRLR